MYEILHAKKFQNDIRQLKAFELILAKYLGLFAVNPLQKSLKSIHVKEGEFFGCFRSEVGGKLYIFWRFGEGQRIYFIAARKK